jgi:hypothetical protein
MPVTISGSGGITTGSMTATDVTVSGNLFTERYGMRYRQARYDGVGGSANQNPSVLDYRIFGGLNFKNLGHFNFRADNQYLHVKTNVTSNSEMHLFFIHGYLYSNGNCFSIAGGYTFTAPSTILNQSYQNLGAVTVSGTYRTAAPSSGGFLCLRLNRNSSGYTEGYVTVYYHTHGNEMNNAEVLSFSQNNNAGAFYAS